MRQEHHPIKETIAHMAHAWREAASFLLSIELWMMVLVAFATVGGVWLAVMGSGWSLPAFGFAAGYLVLRPVLHRKRILAWPFM